MSRTLIACLFSLAAVPAYAAVDCTGTAAPVAATARATSLAPVASEFNATETQLGAPSGVLAQGFNEAESADRVAARLRAEGCKNVAAAVPAAAATAAVNDAAGYKPKTEFDNTPWRFDMSQNGKRMTADEFDAWMKARGVRVVGKPAAAPAAVPAAAVDPAKKD